MARPTYTCQGADGSTCGKRHGTFSGAEDCCADYFARTGKRRQPFSSEGPNAPRREAA